MNTAARSQLVTRTHRRCQAMRRGFLAQTDRWATYPAQRRKTSACRALLTRLTILHSPTSSNPMICCQDSVPVVRTYFGAALRRRGCWQAPLPCSSWLLRLRRFVTTLGVRAKLWNRQQTTRACTEDASRTRNESIGGILQASKNSFTDLCWKGGRQPVLHRTDHCRRTRHDVVDQECD